MCFNRISVVFIIWRGIEWKRFLFYVLKTIRHYFFEFKSCLDLRLINAFLEFISDKEKFHIVLLSLDWINSKHILKNRDLDGYANIVNLDDRLTLVALIENIKVT